MNTECFTKKVEFQAVGSRKIEADFSAGHVSSDAGVLALREVEKGRGFIEKFSKCFTDHRNPDFIEHPLEDLIVQRAYGIALGYEDLNDHDVLRKDPAIAALIGKEDPEGLNRKEPSKGKSLAGKSTLSRMDLSPHELSTTAEPMKISESSDKKIICHPDLIESFLDSYKRPPEKITLDFDATDTPLHGHQEERFFHGYYGHYCYLPLYVFCGQHLLSGKLRPSNKEAAFGSKSAKVAGC